VCVGSVTGGVTRGVTWPAKSVTAGAKTVT
jgi:hypothetical protein